MCLKTSIETETKDVEARRKWSGGKMWREKVVQGKKVGVVGDDRRRAFEGETG